MELKIADSPALKRLTTAGFTIDKTLLNRYKDCFNIYWRFTCVCGRTEPANISFNKEKGLPIWVKKLTNRSYEADIAYLMEVRGDISVEHLRKDGYSEDEIKHIRRAYND